MANDPFDVKTTFITHLYKALSYKYIQKIGVSRNKRLELDTGSMNYIKFPKIDISLFPCVTS